MEEKKKKKTKILVVDDEEAFGQMLRINLEGAGAYEVRFEKLASRALQTAQEFGPDLMILDIMMRDQAGPVTASQFRADARFRELPVVFLSAASPRPAAAGGTGMLGGFPCLPKPVRTEDLVAFIEKTLREKKA
jgi:DNA-binding response OmpR family regulator